MANSQPTLIGILDFNPMQPPDRLQYAKKISELLPQEMQCEKIFFRDATDLEKYSALILTGSKMSAEDYQTAKDKKEELKGDFIPVDDLVVQLRRYKGPILGICFGAQLLAYALGGRIGSVPEFEMGFLDHQLTEDGRKDSVLGHLDDKFYGFQIHNNIVLELPKSSKSGPGNSVKESKILAMRNNFIHAYSTEMADGTMRYGVQPHPEMTTERNIYFFPKLKLMQGDITEEQYKEATKIPADSNFRFNEVIKRFAETCR